MAKQVLNYHDVQLYESDVALFATNQWLNDNAINFYFQYVNHSVCLPGAAREAPSSTAHSNVLLMDPAVVSCMMLQCDDDDEYADLGRGIQVHSKTFCLIPVNDNQSFDSESSHWSLLVFDMHQQKFTHYDSSAGHNTSAATRIARTFLRLLTASGVCNVPEWSSDCFANAPDAPQQQNGYDCGMYVLAVAEFLCRERYAPPLLSTPTTVKPRVALHENVTPARVTALRLEIPRTIQRLRDEQ